MKAIETKIKFYRQNTINYLHKELKIFSSASINNIDIAYYKWYMDLENIRKYLLDIIYRYHPTYNHSYLLHGHRIDHHIYGYVAPMEILCKGYQEKVRTPAEQLAFLSQQFRAHGIRFIYVALPCKKAVYPEIILPKYLLSQHSNIIPQWRRMIYDLILHDVEVIDTYSYFLQFRNTPLFSYGHDISCAGAKMVGKLIGDYLLDTTQNIEFPTQKLFFTTRVYSLKEDNIEYNTEQVNYSTHSGGG